MGSREELISKLFLLRTRYNWDQFMTKCALIETPESKASTHSCINRELACEEAGNSLHSLLSENSDQSPVRIQKSKQSRSARKVILDSSEDESIKPHNVVVDLTEEEEDLMVPPPSTIRKHGKNSRVIVSDSESDTALKDGEDLELQDSEAGDSSDSDGEGIDAYDHDDGWIVNDSEEEISDVDYSDDDEYDSESATKENVCSNKVQSSTPFSKTSFQKTRTPSRNDKNFKRVEALSTGKKKSGQYHQKLAVDLYHIYNEVIFDNQLPRDMSVTWNKRMLTTGGWCKCVKQVSPVSGELRRIVSIELSSKVVDSEVRMRETLAHEMCHAACFLIDQEDNHHHGPRFKAWGRRVTRKFPDIGVVSTCHSYKIHKPHKFKCINLKCGVVYSRHSKKGLDVDKKCCGVCRSRLEYQGRQNKDGQNVKFRQVSGFSLYVKNNFGRIKSELQARGEEHSTKDVMRALAAQYKLDKAAGLQAHSILQQNSHINVWNDCFLDKIEKTEDDDEENDDHDNEIGAMNASHPKCARTVDDINAIMKELCL